MSSFSPREDDGEILTGHGGGRRPKGETAVWTLDKDTKECLNYEGVPAVPKLRKATIPNPKVFLKTRGEIEIRNDLIDCGIDVCSAEVLHFPSCGEFL